MTPPALIGEGTVSEKVLDQALMESEVSAYLMHRIFLSMSPGVYFLRGPWRTKWRLVKISVYI